MRHANMGAIQAWASAVYHPGMGLREELIAKMVLAKRSWYPTPNFSDLGEYRWWEPAPEAIERIEENARWAAEQWPVRGLRRATLVREYRRVLALEMLVNLNIGL